MAITFPITRTGDSGDRMGFSLFVAIAAHALVIFGIGFKLLQQPQTTTTLEITLAQYQSETPDEEADFLAQHNQQGSGEQQERQALTSPRPTIAEDSRTQQLSAPTPQQQQQFQVSPETLISTVSPSPDKSRDAPEQLEQQTTPSQKVLPVSQFEQIASLKAQLDQHRQAYSKIPKVRRINTNSAKAAAEAAYLHYWIQHVESVGNQNYPEEARRKKIYGDLRLAVTLLPDGSVDDVEILLSSGQRVLDQAAIRIVRIASPFQALSEEMAEWDKLEIIRTWRFEKGNTLNTEAEQIASPP